MKISRGSVGAEYLLRALFIQVQLLWVLLNRVRGLALECNFLAFDAADRDSLQATLVVFDNIARLLLVFKYKVDKCNELRCTVADKI
jgi:hypothetical protein